MQQLTTTQTRTWPAYPQVSLRKPAQRCEIQETNAVFQDDFDAPEASLQQYSATIFCHSPLPLQLALQEHALVLGPLPLPLKEHA
jgi:hypothetical protein